MSSFLALNPFNTNRTSSITNHKYNNNIKASYKYRNHRMLIQAVKQQQKKPTNIPDSKEEMLQQVQQIVSLAVQKIGKVQKGFASKQTTNYEKLMIEVLVQGEQSEIELLQNIANSLPTRFKPTLIVSGNNQIVNKSSKKIVNLKQGLSQVSEGKPKSLIIGNSTVGQLQEVYQLCDDNNKTDLKIIVNSDWCLDPPTGWGEFCENFLPIYVFRPLEVKGLLGQKMGFMFKSGIEENSAYRFYLSDDKDGSLNQIGQQTTRPSQEDIETVMYNANAAQSPINKGLQWMQQKIGKK